MALTRPVRVLAIMEASGVSGPAKNLIGFGAWTQSREAAEWGAKVSVTVATYCRDPDDGSKNAFLQAARAAGVDARVIQERKRFDRSVLPQLRELAAAIKPDIIQTHNTKSHAVLKASGIAPDTRWLAFQHGYTQVDLKMRMYDQLDRWSLRSAHRVVTVCRAFVPKLISYGVQEPRVRVLHNSVVPPEPVAETAQAELRGTLGVAPEDKMIFTAGRFSKEKAHVDLIHALHLLSRDIPHGWKAVLAGSGPEMEAVKQLITQLGIADRVIFAGFQKDLSAFYAAADIFALPSHSEGSPNVILEAMAARLPIAATAAGGTPEIVADQETALLTPVADPGRLAASLARLLREEALGTRLADAAFARACRDFSPQQYMRAVLDIYADALNQPA